MAKISRQISDREFTNRIAQCADLLMNGVSTPETVSMLANVIGCVVCGTAREGRELQALAELASEVAGYIRDSKRFNPTHENLNGRLH